MAETAELPIWRWDQKAGGLVPLCPKCAGVIQTDGARLTCLIMGFSHYNQRLDQVLELSQRRLAGDS